MWVVGGGLILTRNFAVLLIILAFWLTRILILVKRRRKDIVFN